MGKLVLKTQVKIGILGKWTDKTCLSPFERIELGGEGLNNQNFGLNARNIISLRGYNTSDIMAVSRAARVYSTNTPWNCATRSRSTHKAPFL